MADTPWIGSEADKLYLTSGQFSSTLKTSQEVTTVDITPVGITWDGTDTPWAGQEASKLYLISGQFTSTIKDSEDVSGIDAFIQDISWDGTDTPWVGTEVDKVYLTSGQFTSTIKTSQSVTTVDGIPKGISFDGTNTPWCGSEDDKLYLTSGQFSSTIKTSQEVTTVDTAPEGISWDGTNTPWCGNQGDKLYLTSGQFSSTLKTSEAVGSIDTSVFGIDTNDVDGRLGGGAPSIYEKSVSSGLIFAGTDSYTAEFNRSESSSLNLSGTDTSTREFNRSETSSLVFSQNIQAPKEMTVVLSSNLNLSGTGVYTAEFSRSESSSLDLTAADTSINEFTRSETAALIFTQDVAIPIRLVSRTSNLIFGQNVTYTFEASRTLSSTVDFTGAETSTVEFNRSLSSNLEFTQEGLSVAPISESSDLIFGHTVGIALQRSLSNNLIFGQTVEWTLDLAPTICGLREHWARWIFASVSKYFSEVADDNELHFFVEGTHRSTQDHTKFIEFRMDGPSVTEMSKNYFHIDVEINMLWSFNQDNTSFHEPYRISGILTKAMQNICIYRYGNDGIYDDDTLLGTLSLRQDKKNPIRVNNFGQVRSDVKLMQGTVEGSFRMVLTCTGR